MSYTERYVLVKSPVVDSAVGKGDPNGDTPRDASKASLGGKSSDVKADQKGLQKDSSVDIPPVGMAKVMSLMKSQMKGSQKPIRTVLIGTYQANFVSGANSNFFGLNALGPIGVQDWSSFGAVYDLARVVGLKIHVNGSYSATPTTLCAWWALAFDPFNPGAYATAADVLTAKNVIGPVLLSDALSGTNVYTSTGFHHMSLKLPVNQLIMSNQVTGAPGGGGWFATSTTSFTCGYLKSTQGACGSGITSTLTVIVEYICEFRNRT